MTALRELVWVGIKSTRRLRSIGPGVGADDGVGNDLGENQIGGCEALALAQRTALGSLDLDRNQIGAKGCEALAPALAQRTMKRRIEANRRKRLEALAPALAQMTTLGRLHLRVIIKSTQKAAKHWLRRWHR